MDKNNCNKCGGEFYPLGSSRPGDELHDVCPICRPFSKLNRHQLQKEYDEAMAERAEAIAEEKRVYGAVMRMLAAAERYMVAEARVHAATAALRRLDKESE